MSKAKVVKLKSSNPNAFASRTFMDVRLPAYNTYSYYNV